MKSNYVMSIGWGATALLVGAAVTLYWLARGNDPTNYRDSIAEVREIQQLAADWSIETARVRSDPLADFDSLAAFIPRMDELKQNLMNTIRAIPDIPDRLANDVSAYVNAVEAREERIERFKTGYAIIRNSARYLPLAASTIVQSPDIDTDLSREVSALTNDINGYLRSPSDSAKGRLTVAIERLTEAAGAQEAPLTDRLANFIAHANVLLAQQAPTSELFSQATSSEISELSAQLVDDLGIELAKKSQLSSNYVGGILGAGGVLVLMWIVISAVRLRAGQAPATDAIEAEAAEAARPLASSPAPASGDAWAIMRQLLSHRILSRQVASELASAAGAIGEQLDSLRSTGDAKAFPAELHNGASTLTEVSERVDRIRDLADRLSTYSGARNDEVSYTLLSLNDCLGEVLEELDAESVAEVTTEFGQVPEIFAAKTEICLMFAKVFENSLQAIADAGKEQGELRVSTNTDGDRATVTIIDNGAGMTAETKERMFEPFFSGNEDRDGVGLVSTGHLVEKYGGTVSFKSMVGGGTVARIQLPGMEQG